MGTVGYRAVAEERTAEPSDRPAPRPERSAPEPQAPTRTRTAWDAATPQRSGEPPREPSPPQPPPDRDSEQRGAP